MVIEYKINDGEWISADYASESLSIQVNAGDVVQLRGNNATYYKPAEGKHMLISSTASLEAEGNMMSLVNSTGFGTDTTLTGEGTFFGLFSECTNLISVENLVLPATTLTDGCYYQMFYGCTSLTTAPELPATTLGESCYSHMFDGCTGLTTAPSLPATTLADYCYQYMFYECTSLATAPSILPAATLAYNCYQGMFQGCTSLTEAPELPATTLANYCYDSMFYGCTSLNYIKCLATNISASYCTRDWVNGVASTGTFVKNPNMSSWSTGCNGIPSNWTVQDAQ